MPPAAFDSPTGHKLRDRMGCSASTVSRSHHNDNEKADLTHRFVLASPAVEGVGRLPAVENDNCETEVRSNIHGTPLEVIQERMRNSPGFQTNDPISLDDFEMLSVLGRGKFGKVMKVQKRDSGRVYALKTIKKSSLSNSVEAKFVIAERRILADVEHPYVVRLHYAWQTETKLYFVIDLVEGGELFYHLRQREKFSILEARLMIAELLLALRYLHSKSIIYRDLKPENVLMTTDGHIKLTDFGISIDSSEPDYNDNGSSDVIDGDVLSTVSGDGDDNESQNISGTLDYMAPEVLKGETETSAVDVWALGVMIYELLTGMHPFRAEKRLKTIRRIRKGAVIMPDELPSDAADLIRSLLVVDARQRPKLDEAMNHAFFKGLDWARVEKCLEKPVYKPRHLGSLCLLNFDSTFTNERPVDSPTCTPVHPAVKDHLSKTDVTFLSPAEQNLRKKLFKKKHKHF